MQAEGLQISVWHINREQARDKSDIDVGRWAWLDVRHVSAVQTHPDVCPFQSAPKGLSWVMKPKGCEFR